MTARRAWLTVIIIGAAVLVVVSAIMIWNLGREKALWGESDAMRMVRAESLADPSLLGFKLLTSSYEQRGDWMKTSGPSATNCFAIEGDAEVQMQHAINYAIAEGWEELADTRTASTWVGDKPASLGGEMNGGVSIVESGDVTRCPAGSLQISVSY